MRKAILITIFFAVLLTGCEIVKEMNIEMNANLDRDTATVGETVSVLMTPYLLYYGPVQTKINVYIKDSLYQTYDVTLQPGENTIIEKLGPMKENNAGDLTIKFVIDETNLLSELDESDNTAYASLTVRQSKCIESGYQCTSKLRGCGHYTASDYPCGQNELICCKGVPACGDGVCFTHNLSAYTENSQNCPSDCGIGGGGDGSASGPEYVRVTIGASAITSKKYKGMINLNLNGSGGASYDLKADTIYIYTDWDGGSLDEPEVMLPYLLCMNKKPITGYLSRIPPYNKQHVYNLRVNVTQESKLEFGICDTDPYGKSGFYHITISENAVEK